MNISANKKTDLKVLLLNECYGKVKVYQISDSTEKFAGSEIYDCSADNPLIFSLEKGKYRINAFASGKEKNQTFQKTNNFQEITIEFP